MLTLVSVSQALERKNEAEQRGVRVMNDFLIETCCAQKAKSEADDKLIELLKKQVQELRDLLRGASEKPTKRELEEPEERGSPKRAKTHLAPGNCYVCGEHEEPLLACERCNQKYVHDSCALDREPGTPIGWYCTDCQSMSLKEMEFDFGLGHLDAARFRTLSQRGRKNIYPELQPCTVLRDVSTSVEKQLYLSLLWTDGSRTMEAFGAWPPFSFGSF